MALLRRLNSVSCSCGTIATRTALTNSIGVHIKFQPRNSTIPGRAGLVGHMTVT